MDSKRRAQTLPTVLLGSVLSDIHTKFSLGLLEEETVFNAEHRKNTPRCFKWLFLHWSGAFQRNEPGASGTPN